MREHPSPHTISPLLAEAAAPLSPYTLEVLSIDDVDAMNALQIRCGSHNVVMRDTEYYRAHFEADYSAIGFKDKLGQLVAHALIKTEGRCTTTLNVLVCPHHRGHKLQSQMINQWLDAAKLIGMDHAQARVRTSNFVSITNFKVAEFYIKAIEPSPDEPHCMTYLMEKSLKNCSVFNIACRLGG